MELKTGNDGDTHAMNFLTMLFIALGATTCFLCGIICKKEYIKEKQNDKKPSKVFFIIQVVVITPVMFSLFFAFTSNEFLYVFPVFSILGLIGLTIGKEITKDK